LEKLVVGSSWATQRTVSPLATGCVPHGILDAHRRTTIAVLFTVGLLESPNCTPTWSEVALYFQLATALCVDIFISGILEFFGQKADIETRDGFALRARRFRGVAALVTCAQLVRAAALTNLFSRGSRLLLSLWPLKPKRSGRSAGRSSCS
jgi:hypothetical protein